MSVTCNQDDGKNNKRLIAGYNVSDPATFIGSPTSAGWFL